MGILLSLVEFFLGLFFITFIVGLLAFSAYGYLLILLLRNHSEKFDPQGIGGHLLFLWELLVYYISRAFSGFFGFKRPENLQFYIKKNKAVQLAESENEKLVWVYTIFSTLYIIFFLMLLLLIVVFIYMVL